MRRSRLNVRQFAYSPFVPRPSSLVPHSLSRGFTYIGLLVIIVIIGISLGAAGKYWQNVMLRDKEEELLFRGDQYRLAIERYYMALPGRQMYPKNIDDLLKDNRTATGKRHLRRKYKDPITGEDFQEIRDPVLKSITGVCSSSDKKPLKQDNFPELYKDFASKETYSQWAFVSSIKPVQQPPVMRPPIQHHGQAGKTPLSGQTFTIPFSHPPPTPPM